MRSPLYFCADQNGGDCIPKRSYSEAAFELEVLVNSEERVAYERMKAAAIREAVRRADQVIVDSCAGNPEVLMLLTAEVAKIFSEKVVMMADAEVNKKEILCQVPPKLMPWGTHHRRRAELSS